MNISLTDILFILIIFQLLFLSFFLFTQQKGGKLSNRLLGFFFLFICLNLLDVFILYTGFYFAHPDLAGFGSCLPLLFGPLLYVYTQSILYKNYKISKKNLLHFLPFLVVFSGTELYYLIQPNDVKEGILKSLHTHHFPLAVSIVSAMIFIQFLFYAGASLRSVLQYKKATIQLFSDPKHINVSWLYSTVIFFISIIVITILNSLLAQTSFVKYYLLTFNIVTLALLLFVTRVLMKALHQSYFFSFPTQEDLRGQFFQPKRPIPDAERSEKEAIIQSVIQHMQSEKPYLEPELSLDELALQLSIKPRVLSQAINDILQQNFFDFINRYRIEEARRLLTNPADKKITVLEVLYKVGFNSKSSFNTLFKKYTGLTPTEFRNKQTR
jgi:AraC-like DNA-binding protein